MITISPRSMVVVVVVLAAKERCGSKHTTNSSTIDGRNELALVLYDVIVVITARNPMTIMIYSND